MFLELAFMWTLQYQTDKNRCQLERETARYSESVLYPNPTENSLLNETENSLLNETDCKIS